MRFKNIIFLVAIFCSLGRGTSYSNLYPTEEFYKSLLPNFLRGNTHYDSELGRQRMGIQCLGLLKDCSYSSAFGIRRHPIFGFLHLHKGIDLAAEYGAPIISPADGVVIASGWSIGYGKVLTIDHGMGWTTRYAHLSKVYVRRGERVKGGELIGRVGRSGLTTGPHLHFEIRYQGMPLDPINHYLTLRELGERQMFAGNK